jgi:nitrogen regulatory protein P-II 1
MQLMVMVLNRVEALDSLLERFMEDGICGATILNSTGMVKELAKSSEDFPIFGTLRMLINPDRKESKTLFMVLTDEKVEKAKNIIRDVVGDLSEPDSAVVFTLPVLSTEGVEF